MKDVLHTWKLDKSEPLMNQADVPYIHGPLKSVYLSGLGFWQLHHVLNTDYGYIDFITSQGNISEQFGLKLNIHDLAQFCRKFLLGYDDGWVIRNYDDDGRAIYWVQEECLWTDDLEGRATMYNSDSTLDEHFQDSFNSPGDIEMGEWIPYAIANKEE